MNLNLMNNRKKTFYAVLTRLLSGLIAALAILAFTGAIPSTVSAANRSQTDDPTPAVQEETGEAVLRGRVVNMSGGEVPAGLEVTLQVFVGMEIAFTDTSTLDQEGGFTFQGLDPAEGQVYIVTVEYSGVVFGSDVIHGEDLLLGDLGEVQIAVYEQTGDPSALYADRAHIFFEFSSTAQVQVVVYLLVSNPTDSVVTATNAGDPVLIFALPADAANLQFEDSGMESRFVPVEGGFGDMMSIRPGQQQHEILFAYNLPYNRKRSIAFSFPVEVQSGTIVVPEGLSLSGDNVQDAGARQMENGAVTLYSFAGLPAGEVLQVELSGALPGAASTGVSSSTGLAIGLGVFALVLVAAGFWLRRKPKTPKAAPVYVSSAASDEGPPSFVHSGELHTATAANPPPGEESAAQSLDALLDAIVELDQAYENDQIAPADYTARRNELKERIREVRNS